MTTPTPSPITFPEWYDPDTGGSPDIEVVMDQLFTPLLGGVEVVSWLGVPSVYNAQLEAGKAYLRAYRVGGTYNFDQNRDEPQVQLAALTRNRDMSWKIAEFVRRMMRTFQRGTGTVPGTTTRIRLEREVIGPQLIPELIVDDRLVPITFHLQVPDPKGLPNYQVALGV